MDMQLQQIQKEAKSYALENKISVAIYREGFEYRYTSAESAIAFGYAIVEVVSGHN